MNLRSIPRTAVDRYLKLARLPWDGATRLLPGDGTGVKSSAQVALDRADAAARSAAAVILQDRTLGEDARRRRQAADERQRAVRLRSQAERTEQRAEARLEQTEEQARQQRRRATQRTKSRREQAEREAQKRKQRAARTERGRLAANREIEHRTEEQIAEREPAERLEALEAKADALKAKERELAARDESRRLGEAAGQLKAERKYE
jgi:hypothetical protein